MEFRLITTKNNHREIAYKLCGFLQAHGINTREKLSRQFDELAEKYAQLNGGRYDRQKRLLYVNR